VTELLNLVLLVAIGVPGWLVFSRLKLPGAPILGSMAAVGISQIYGYAPGALPAWFKPGLQVVVGMFIGLRVRQDARKLLAGMVPVAILVSGWWLVAAFASGHLLYGFSQLDLRTALLGSTPGGISEMGLMALHFGADAASVALLQFFRVTLVLVVVPVFGPRLFALLVRLSGRRQIAREAAASDGAAGDVAAVGAACEVAPGSARRPMVDRPVKARQAMPRPACARDWLGLATVYARTVGVAAIGGVLFEAVGFPAGGLVGSMLAVGALRMAGVACAGFPEDMRNVAQVGLGGLIGLSFTAAMVRSLGSMVLPVVLLTTTLLAFGFVLAVVMHRMTGWDISTCVLSTCAGGLTNISVIAEDFGADPVKVTLLHVVRLITIVAVLPPAFAALF
jgi:membrane AbrB-like protein